MIKIFQYECKRLLWNKFFFGLSLILLFYGWQVLNNATILGVSHTAPFSPWSFGDYLSRMVPLLWMGVLFFLTFFTSGKARRTAALTDATPIQPQIYSLVRCAAALIGTTLLALLCVVEAAMFYIRYFNWYALGSLMFPAVITLVPPLVFALGSGWLLGNLRSWSLYPWMLVPFVWMTLPLPEAFELWNGSFFTEYPLTLGVLDPPFVLPVSTVMIQCVLFIIGVVLLTYKSNRSIKF